MISATTSKLSGLFLKAGLQLTLNKPHHAKRAFLTLSRQTRLHRYAPLTHFQRLLFSSKEEKMTVKVNLSTGEAVLSGGGPAPDPFTPPSLSPAASYEASTAE
jgi:hypothetical protein